LHRFARANAAPPPRRDRRGARRHLGAVRVAFRGRSRGARSFRADNQSDSHAVARAGSPADSHADVLADGRAGTRTDARADVRILEYFS
jgi:hypothetical protein